MVDKYNQLRQKTLQECSSGVVIKLVFTALLCQITVEGVCTVLIAECRSLKEST